MALSVHCNENERFDSIQLYLAYVKGVCVSAYSICRIILQIKIDDWAMVLEFEPNGF